MHFENQTQDISNCVQFIGGIPTTEPPGRELHELSFVPTSTGDIVAVRIRPFSVLGTPTYFIAVGKYIA